MAIANLETTFVRSVSLAQAPGIVALIVAWDARFRARRALAELGPERRCDLGLSARDIATEAAKAPWRP